MFLDMVRSKSLVSNIFSLVSYTNRLIAFTVFCYFVFIILALFIPGLDKFIFLYPNDIIHGQSLWTLLTSMFMHGGGVHLFVNMITLFFLGNFAEQLIGRKRFITLYLIAGLVGGLFYVFGAYIGSQIGYLANVLGTLDMPAVGASGALFGLLGLLAVIVPRFRVYLILGPILVIIASVLAGNFLTGAFGSFFSILTTVITFAMIFFMFSSNPNLRKYSLPVGMDMWLAPIVSIVPLVIISFFVPLPIGNTAHFGGLVVGLIFGAYLRFKYPKKIMLLQRLLQRGGQ